MFLTTHVPIVLLRATLTTSSTSPVNCVSYKPRSLSFALFCSGFRPSLVNCVSDIVTRGFLSICPLFHIRAFGFVAYVWSLQKLILFKTLSMYSIYVLFFFSMKFIRRMFAGTFICYPISYSFCIRRSNFSNDTGVRRT
jgi:hypothetical protein